MSDELYRSVALPQSPEGHRDSSGATTQFATDTYLTEDEVSSRYHASPRTLQRWRVTGDGPSWVRLGQRKVAYRLSDCEAWAAARTFRHRADELSRRVG
jgi:predicted DNA-binding transcriptional regulator AlpA